MAVPRLDLSLAAKSDISNIWRYTAEKWSVEQADAYYESIANALDDIAKGNIVGIPVDIRHGVQKHLLMSHAIYFRASAHAIEVLRVLHQSMDVRRHL
jgi:toxin ParE1/3/4